MTACTLSGIGGGSPALSAHCAPAGRRIPPSSSIRTYSWAYSGLPSATSTSSSGVTARWPNISEYMVLMSLSRSGGSESEMVPVMVPVQLGCCSRSSGRAVQMISRGSPRVDAPSISTNRSIASSAQCMSSKTSTVGWRAAIARRNRRHSCSVSIGDSPAPGSPTSGPSASASRPPSSPVVSSLTAALIRRRAVASSSESRIDASALTMSARAA